ncbi:MAG: helix-turn-helix transcriptional regulator [Methylorubrum populi]
MERTLKAFVERRLAEIGTNPFEAAKSAGLERGFVNDILQGKKSTVRGSNIIKLASALRVDVRTLVEETLNSVPSQELLDWVDKNEPKSADLEFSSEEIVSIQEAVEVYNIIKTNDGKALIEPSPSSFMPTLGFFRLYRISYGVVVYDSDMEPELRPGENAFVDSNFPPVKGNTCLFKGFSDNRRSYTPVKFGILTNISDENWTIKQWNPEKELILSRMEWPVCHKVAGKLSR